MRELRRRADADRRVRRCPCRSWHGRSPPPRATGRCTRRCGSLEDYGLVRSSRRRAGRGRARAPDRHPEADLARARGRGRRRRAALPAAAVEARRRGGGSTRGVELEWRMLASHGRRARARRVQLLDGLQADGLPGVAARSSRERASRCWTAPPRVNRLPVDWRGAGGAQAARDGQAQEDAGLRLQRGVPARLRAALLRRPGGDGRVRRLRQLPRRRASPRPPPRAGTPRARAAAAPRAGAAHRPPDAALDGARTRSSSSASARLRSRARPRGGRSRLLRLLRPHPRASWRRGGPPPRARCSTSPGVGPGEAEKYSGRLPARWLASSGARRDAGFPFRRRPACRRFPAFESAISYAP